ncbi:plexin-A4-like [Clavelina lepadiformis]|uniref:plexin-A4-like n=1 Tax=Clavelina lepadiformis TaxID=159417 RepID=UPI00404168A8
MRQCHRFSNVPDKVQMFKTQSKSVTLTCGCLKNLSIFRTKNFILVFFQLILLSVCDSVNVKERVEYRAQSGDQSSPLFEFKNLVVEQQPSGQVYIGARNRLYQLDADLSNPITVQTGPDDDTVVCKELTDQKCGGDKNADNINKLLLIDYDHDRIVTCGSINEGVCQILQQGNIRKRLDNLLLNETTPTKLIAAPRDLSTVGFIARSNDNKTSLYVGSSKTIKNSKAELSVLFAKQMYTVSKHQLPPDSHNQDMLSALLLDRDSNFWVEAGLVMSSDFAEDGFTVRFIDGFSTDETGYFISTHPARNVPPSLSDPDSFNHVTYISQVCLNEKDMPLHSLLELPLECSFAGIKYTKAVTSRTVVVGSNLQAELQINQRSKEVVFVSFVRSNGLPGSAVCMYPLWQIEDQFLQLIKRCMRSRGRSVAPRAMRWLQKASTECGTVEFDDLPTPVCNNKYIWDVISLLQDYDIVLSSDAFYTTNDTVVTAIEVARNEQKNHTVAFFGTQDGKMIKFRLDSATPESPLNREYETIVIGDTFGGSSGTLDSESLSAVNAIRLGYGHNTDSQRIYAMTPSITVGMPLFDCSQYENCATCLGSRDPFCGWCTLDSKCTSSGDCEGSSSRVLYRFIQSDGECPRLDSDNPLMLPSSQYQKPIPLKGYNIPMVTDGAKYECKFGDLYNYRPPIKKRSGYILIKCVSPPPAGIPRLKMGEGHVVVPLSIVYRGKNALVTANFTFYDCSVHTSCMSCVATDFDCTWCINDNLCTHESSTRCDPQAHVSQVNNCPQLTLLADGTSKFYLTKGKQETIYVPAKRLPSQWKKFSCEITTRSGKKLATGQRSRTGIECQQVEGTLENGVRSTEASLRIVTANRGERQIEIDNPVNLSVEIYQCALEGGGNCGTCLQSPDEWSCGWCESLSRCTLQGDTCIGTWLKASAGVSCRYPRISSFSPMSAPFGSSAETVIRIKGVNLDLNSNMQINVAGVRCNQVQSSCCEAECTPHAKAVISGKITLCITKNSQCLPESSYNTTSAENFEFVDPIVEDFTPNRGLRGWGTRIILSGEHLDTGNDVTVLVDGLPCKVDRSTLGYTNLECLLECKQDSISSAFRKRREVAKSSLRTLFRAERSSSTTVQRVTVNFDNIQRIAKKGYFEFIDHVSITKIDPRQTIRSGGLPLKVRGVNLNLIQNPQMKVTLMKDHFYSDCKLLPDSSLTCISPDLSKSSVFWNQNEAFVRVEIQNKGCPTSVMYNASLYYKPNPTLDLFSDPKIFRGEPIYITGLNLCPDKNLCKSVPAKVYIGEKMQCNVTRLDIDQIACLPPKAAVGEYEIKVQIGGFTSESIGMLQYNEESQFPPAVVGVIVGILVVVAVGIFILVCVYRRRAKASDMEVKNMMMQMNQMESRVAKVCKEAFAELQTDMSQLDTVAGGVGIPYLDYRTYLMRVLFPDPVTAENQHALLLSYRNGREDIRTNSNRPTRPRALGMERFNKLLENKTFLMCFIKALEGQRSFSMTEKAKVAGLIFVILHDRLYYATEILENLLADLIQRNLAGSNHPKLLLRRTESVAEKMLTHWFSILLHRFVVECAGEPLFTLYRAIKQQVDKGPVDAFTNEARYSLSEDKLLRQSVDHEMLTLTVSNYLAEYDQPDFSARVLSCDSISQVKRKILDVAYMNVHYMRRPHPEAIDLEWQTKRGARHVLKDEDHTSKLEGEWKKVNTLEHYTVKSNDKISIIPKQENSILNQSSASALSRSGGLKRNGSGARLLPSEGSNTSLPRHKQVSRSGTPTLPQDGPKLWHLVKPTDQDQREGGDRVGKMVSEVYLTRLLTTKGTIQKYVDDLFETIFSVVQRGHALPLAVKHMFDFLDGQAARHGITDPETVHTWKSNCLPLRFWVNLIKNPEFVYDVHKSPIVDCYLSVIAQAFMDSCSTAEYKLGKDSPSNKLLYAKEIPDYRDWVSRYYSDISRMPKLNSRDLSAFLQEESFTHSQDFNSQAALSQLFTFVEKYNGQILNVLNNDSDARSQSLVKQLEYVSVAMNGGS